MGWPLGPTLANAFLSHYEKIWLEQCPQEIKPLFYRRYVDDIFVLFESQDKLSFLDVNVFREKGQFVTNVYRKLTFSGVYTAFENFLPKTCKFGMVYILVY